MPSTFEAQRHPKVGHVTVESCVAQLDTARERTALVMVGRGSYDPCARSDMLILSHLIEHRSHFGCVRTALCDVGAEAFQDILEEIANQDLFDAVVIQPHLLFEGRLYQAIAKQVENASGEHPNLKWKISKLSWSSSSSSSCHSNENFAGLQGLNRI